MTTLRRTLLAVAAITMAGAAVYAPAALAGDKGQTHEGGPHAVGLVAGDTLVGFDTADPGATYAIGEISGLVNDTSLVGIDFRVQDGMLYGVGNEGGIYTLEKAVATKVGALTVDLDGVHFGVDFNPAANALRVVSDTGQNLRRPFATAGAATVADTPLTNPAVAPATGTVPATGVTAAAYTNNDLSAVTATTLFDLDTMLDRVAIQSPANAGTLAPTGSLPTAIGTDAGLDVYSTVVDGVTTANDAYAAVEVDGTHRLWAVDLLTGGAVDLGAFDAAVTDLAVKL